MIMYYFFNMMLNTTLFSLSGLGNLLGKSCFQWKDAHMGAHSCHKQWMQIFFYFQFYFTPHCTPCGPILAYSK